MKRYLKSLSVAMMVGVIGFSSINPVMSSEVVENDGARVSRSIAPKADDAGLSNMDKAKKGLAVAKTVYKEVKLDEVKGVFGTIKAKVSNELNDYEVKTGKAPSKFRQFWIGFKHGFFETIKYGVKLLVKAAPAIVAML